ncbi:MAG: hypothetical protein IPI11_15060 [Haliscomenobacter sp.]|nr:hypothetical protein [Haliscomenobacter sp.]
MGEIKTGKVNLVELLQQLSAYMLELFNRTPDARLVFHNYELAERMAATVREIAETDGIDPETAQLAELAAWFVPAGFALDYRVPLQASLKEVRAFFQAHRCEEDRRVRLVQCLQTLLSRHTPASAEERLVSDAYLIEGLLREGAQRLALLKLEWEFLEQPFLEKRAWLEVQSERLLRLQLYHRHSKRHYQPLLSSLILSLQQGLEKERRKETEITQPEGRFNYLEPESPVRAAQTFFRANYRNHINLSAIADNKANIMISVNSIMISVLITFLSYRNIAEVKPVVVLPVVIFLVTGLTSLIFAVLSARPKVTSLNRGQKDPKEVRKNLVFFGNFVSLDLEAYEEGMDDLFRNTDLLYGNMTRDLYHLGKVLDKKYRYLTISYNLFMVGFVATVLTFLVVLFI